jgi:hypothetical protein
MRPKRFTDPKYVRAFAEMAARIATSLGSVSARALPIKMYVAGGAALHFYTGARISVDVDAAFSHRISLPEDLEVSYIDNDGSARLLYFDKQYNDMFGLMHEDAHDESIQLSLSGINAKVLDVRLLSPLDLAVSKLGRFSEQDRADIAELAKRGLIDSEKLRARAENALIGYVGDTQRTQGSINLACRLIDGVRARPRALTSSKKKRSAKKKLPARKKRSAKHASR